MTHYHGGPCDGFTLIGRADQVAVCRSALYTRGPNGDYYMLGTAGVGLPPVGLAGVVGARPPLSQTWHRLMRELSHGVPHSVRRIHAARNRVRRAVR